IVEKSQGFHFNASHMSSEKLDQFSRTQMAENMEQKCPHLWRLIQLLLNAPLAHKATDSTQLGKSNQWVIDVRTSQGHRIDSTDAQGRRIELSIVRCVSIMSILMQNANSKCNGLQTLVSLFAHSTHTPESVVEVLAHAGLGLSPSSINNMVQSMSENAVKKLQTLLLDDSPQAVAYDNLDINFKTEQPTAEYSGHLAHITTGTFIPLQGATKDDLRVSSEIWEKAEINP
ncbi:hypothetical protein BDV93DRAFT_418027, partial [Ceratobasidium sp. AG-I]